MSRTLFTQTLDAEGESSEAILPAGRKIDYSAINSSLEYANISLYRSDNGGASWQIAKDLDGSSETLTVTTADSNTLSGTIANNTKSDIRLKWVLIEVAVDENVLGGETAITFSLEDIILREFYINDQIAFTISEQAITSVKDHLLSGDATVTGTLNANGDLILANIDSYADNAAALADGKAVGTLAIINSALEIVVGA